MTLSFFLNRRRLVSLQNISGSASLAGQSTPQTDPPALQTDVPTPQTDLPTPQTGMDSPRQHLQTEWQAIHHVDAQIFMGQTHAFLTERPTQILRLLSRLDQPSSGRIRWKGDHNLLRRHPHGVAYVPGQVSLTPGHSVNDELLISLASAGQNIDSDRFDQLLQAANVDDLRDCFTQDLSDAQTYLVALVRALMLGASLLAVEEPTADLSRDDAEIVMEALARIAGIGVAVVIQTRSPEVAARCDAAFLLVRGRLLGQFSQPPLDVLRAEYAAALLPAASATAPLNEASAGVPRSSADEASAASDAEADLAPRWVPTRSAESAPLVPIPVATLPAVVGESLEQVSGEELPQIPAVSYVEIDVDSEEVIARAQDILKDLPGSVVPERED